MVTLLKPFFSLKGARLGNLRRFVRQTEERLKLFNEVLSKKKKITLTTEIHARSLDNFYCQYSDRHKNLKFMRRVSERERAIRQFVIVKEKTN